MKTGRLFSRGHHLPLSLLFAGLALFLLSFKLPSFPQNPGLLLIITTVYGMVILYTSIVLSRKQWIIAPIIGVVVTLVSALYSTTLDPVNPCGATLISQGFPYPWIRRFGFPSDGRCTVYYQPAGAGLRQLLFPSPIMSYTWFITDTAFYTLLVLAVIELFAAARRS